MKKQYRVKKSQEIEKILKEKKYSSNPYFSLYKRYNNETTNFRYAISVGRKIGNAVVRNRVKRQITAILGELPIDLNSKVDVFIIVRPSIHNLDYAEMKNQLEYLLKKQKLI